MFRQSGTLWTAVRSAFTLLAIGTAALLVGWDSSSAQQRATQPNIVLFLTDDQRFDSLEYMPIVQRELVSRGITFTNAYATTPQCCPSRASILSGLYARHHGVLYNVGSQGGYRRFDPTSTIATWLQAGGVRTMLVGKYLNLYENERVPPGWDEWYAFLDNGFRYFDFTMNRNGELRTYSDKDEAYSTYVLTRHATHLLKQRTDEPFFLYFSYAGPHAPAEPAREDRKRFETEPLQRRPSFDEEDVSDKPSWVQQLPPLTPEQVAELDKFSRDQLATLQSIDRSIGEVVERLRADGRLDDTWLVLTSDNGLSLGEHRFMHSKSCGYEECIRVPLVVVPPLGRAAEFSAPRSDPRIVLNIDLAPTFAELAGVQPDRTVDGLSLTRMLADPQSAWRDAGGLELWAEDDRIGFQGIRAGQWKYLRLTDGEQELYDLEQDPYELENLARRPEQASRLEQLSTQLDELIR